jgi:hypothetical protein
MTTALEALLTTLAALVATYRGNLAAFANSVDALDRYAPAAVRDAAKDVARAVACESAEVVAAAAAGVATACAGDEWARAEVAGRFLSAVKRLQLVTTIKRHPRAGRFSTLVSAIESGRFSKAQYKLATELAAEVA